MNSVLEYLHFSPLAGLGFLISYILLRTVYQAIYNPLASLPGPQISKWTSLVVTYYWIIGQRPQYVHALHEKYGPTVRVSPNEVDTCDVAAARQIHKVGGRFPKSSWYRALVSAGVENVFSTTDSALHSILRRLLSGPISESSLKHFEPIIMDQARQVMRQMETELKTHGMIDVYKWWTFFATDVIGELSFGQSFRMLEQSEKNQYSLDLEYISSLQPIRTTFPFLVRLSQFVKIPVARRAVDVGRRLSTYATQSIERYKTLISVNPASPKPTLFTKLFNAGEDGLSDLQIRNEAMGYIVAGSDTTAVTLTYLIYAVCRDIQIRDTLVAELASLPDSFTDEDLRNLPFLTQVINETLRLYSAVPSGLPRVVPPEGANLAGYQLPPGVIILTQAYSLHRDPSIFPEPARFNPNRWAAPTKQMKNAFMPFGGGSRICLGMHLARLEMRLATAHFFRRYRHARVSARNGMSEAVMIPKAFFLMAPQGHRCLIEE